jgi:hypothetical protein
MMASVSRSRRRARQTRPCPATADFAGFTTRTDQAQDSVPLDMGYHYPVIVPADRGAGDGGK